jgi:hypothetical protein
MSTRRTPSPTPFLVSVFWSLCPASRAPRTPTYESCAQDMRAPPNGGLHHRLLLCTASLAPLLPVVCLVCAGGMQSTKSHKHSKIQALQHTNTRTHHLPHQHTTGRTNTRRDAHASHFETGLRFRLALKDTPDTLRQPCGDTRDTCLDTALLGQPCPLVAVSRVSRQPLCRVCRVSSAFVAVSRCASFC